MRVVRWALLFVILVIFASGCVAVYTVFFSTIDDVTMPPLREMSVIEAAAEAERLGFTVKIEQVVSSLPPGRVLAQSPEAGLKVRKERTVLLQVSKGGTRRPVPDVRGLVVAQAQSVIQEQGFGIGDVIYIKDDSRPMGAVIAQSPAAPANVPSDKKIDLLVNQSGAGVDGKILVPDVAQMSEREARELLIASGLRVATVDPVYSPNATDGYVIGTRPAAGTAARVGDGVRLRVATTRRPAGVPEPPASIAANPSALPGRTASQIVVTVPGHGDIFVGEGIDPNAPATPARVVDSNVSVFDQRPQVIQNPSLSANTPIPATTAPATTQPPAQAATGQAPQAANPQNPQAANTQATNPARPGTSQPVNLQPVGGKIARVRYQVPPLARSLQLKIELVDPSGSKVLLERDAKSGEYVSLDAPYSKECVVTIYLGGEFVWQDRYM
ncbi:MAG: PASTA domain-containing protein [Synergistaceae bacterium]|jgi:serine/threonine-protein kinase|nr:PASTA domain-containing protein [Synergistaceae bacterium]